MVAVIEIGPATAESYGGVAIHLESGRPAAIVRSPERGWALRESIGEEYANGTPVQTDAELMAAFRTATRPVDPGEFVD